MVQRKVPNKLGIQADHVKSNKLLVNLKPPSLQQQDSKNRGPDLKKKMKKSRPARHLEHERLGSSNFIRQVPQPGKPPSAPVLPSIAPSPQKKTPIKTSDTTPNYMKSTTSFDARKELSQVSSRNLQALFDGKSSSKKISNSSKDSSAPDHKPSRTLARTSSLKLVRSLTKTTSFKPARASGKKCSPLVLGENLNVQRATCSSTLKNYNFPDYLTLNSGGTEAEGTSIMKVCPYSYCSLNGHHHPPLPPLTCFLSAKRRILKTQRTIKLGCLSPRRSKPNKGIIGENERFANDEVLNTKAISPIIQEEHEDFFVEIYSNEMDAAADINATSKCKVNDQSTSDASFNYIPPSIGVRDEIAAEPEDSSEIDACGNSNENGETISTCTNTAEYSAEENQNSEEVGEVYTHHSTTEKSWLEYWSRKQDEEERTENIDVPEFGTSDMDWEIGGYSTLYLDDEVDNLLQKRQDFGMEGDPDEIESRSFEEIQVAEVMGKSFDQESISSNAGSNQDFEIDEYIQRQNPHLLVVSPTMDEKGNNVMLGDSVQGIVTITANPLEHPIEEPCAAAENKYKASEVDNETTKTDLQVTDGTANPIQTEVDAFIGYSENESEHDDYAAQQTWNLDAQDLQTEKNCVKNHYLLTTDAGLGVQEKEKLDPVKELIRLEIVISLQGSVQPVKDKSKEDYDDSHLDVIAEDKKSNQTFAEDLPDGTQDHPPNEKLTSGGIENLNSSEKNEAATKPFECTDSGDQADSRMKGFSLADNAHQDSCLTEMQIPTDSGEETISASNNTSTSPRRNDLGRSNSDKEVEETGEIWNWTRGCKRSIEEDEEPKEFNPRAPNFLPVEPDQEAEKVDLKHQMGDESKNSEEWMLDYALRQAVVKLAPARRRKVALLVEAFETVMPVTKCDTKLRHTSVAFDHAPQIQACN